MKPAESKNTPERERTRKFARPFVLVNMAITADGKIATANHALTSFGSKRDLVHLYALRATADAVMSGARTIKLSHAKLDPGGERFQRLRLANGLAEFNLRIIVSGSGSIDPQAEIFRHHFSPIILLTTERAGAGRIAALRKICDEVLICGRHDLDLLKTLQHLHSRWKVKRLLCEGGGELNDALFRSGLVDEIHLTVCPKIFGGRNAPTIADGLGAAHLTDATYFHLTKSQRMGDELFLVFAANRRSNATSKSARGGR